MNYLKIKVLKKYKNVEKLRKKLRAGNNTFPKNLN
jgi:hypothetical protein